MSARADGFVAALIALAISGCQNADLSRALEGDDHRAITPAALAATDVPWQRIALPSGESEPRPAGLCWLHDTLVIADASNARLIFWSRHEPATTIADSSTWHAPVTPSAVSCSASGSRLLVVDAVNSEVDVLSAQGTERRAMPAPPTPQGVPYLGTFTVADDGRWYDSWLAAPVGPYLSDSEWSTAHQVRAWNADGSSAGGFGTIADYSNTVLRRLFNAPAIQARGDTVFILTEASATLRAYDREGGLLWHLSLPVHHRGAEPYVSVGGRIGASRRNKAAYQPNVRGLALLGDHFATIRFRNWSTRQLPREGTTYWAESAIEIFDRLGGNTIDVQLGGRAEAIAGNEHGDLAALTTDEAGERHVFVARVADLLKRMRPRGAQTITASSARP